MTSLTLLWQNRRHSVLQATSHLEAASLVVAHPPLTTFGSCALARRQPH